MGAEAAVDAVQPSFHRCFTGHSGAITSLHCRPSLHSDFQFLSGSTDSSLILWKYRPHLSAYRLVGHTQPVTAVRWQPGAARIASSSRDGSIRIWDADPERRVRPNSAMRRAWASASASVPSSSFSSRCHVTRLRTEVNSVDWDHRGDWLIASCADDIIRAFRCRTDGEKAEQEEEEEKEERPSMVRVQQTGSLFGHIAGVTSALFTPDSLLVCSGSEDGTVRVWDFDRLRSLHRYSQYTASVRSLCLHPHGNALATLSDSAVSLLDIRSHQLLQQYSVAADSPSAPTAAFTSSTSALSFSPDGRHLYVCGPLGVSVMDLRVGRVQWRVQGHEGPVTAVDVMDDGASFVTAGEDQRLCSWTFTQAAEQISRPGSRQQQQRRGQQRPASTQQGSGFVAPNLPRPSRRDALYEQRAATDKSSSRPRQPPVPRPADIARSRSHEAAGTARAAAGRARGDDGCGYRHRHIGQDGAVWEYEPPQPQPPQPVRQQQQQHLPPQPASAFAPPVPSASPSHAPSAPLLHHNHSRVYRSSHLHATPVDDLVQRLPEQLTGALQAVQRQLSGFSAALRRMETRMAASEERLEQVDDSVIATAASARAAAEEAGEEDDEDEDDESDSKYRYD